MPFALCNVDDLIGITVKSPATKSYMLIGLLGFIFLFSGCARKAPSRSAASLVYTASPTQRDLSIYSEWIGTTVAFVDAEIHSQVAGYLSSQNYKEGSLVRKGDLLFQVDPRPFHVLVDQANARLDAARGHLDEALAETKQGEAEIDRAKAVSGKSDLDVRRCSPLASDGTVSQQELDNAVQVNFANKAAVEVAEHHYEEAKAQAATAEANVNVARSALQQAQLNPGFTRVTAPVDGIAGIHVANIGDLVGGDQRSILTSISTTDPIFVEFPISEQEYLDLRALWLGASGQTPNLELILVDGTTYPRRGAIDIVGSQVNPATGTLRVRALFANPGNVLRPGQYERVRAATETQKGAPLLPQSAIEELQGTYRVMVVGASNKCEIRSVEAGERIGSYWVIPKGLKPADQVIIEGLQKVRTGDIVAPVPGRLPPLQWTQ